MLATLCPLCGSKPERAAVWGIHQRLAKMWTLLRNAIAKEKKKWSVVWILHLHTPYPCSSEWKGVRLEGWASQSGSMSRRGCCWPQNTTNGLAWVMTVSRSIMEP